MFNIIKAYYKLMKTFNRSMRDLKNQSLHQFDDEISFFDYIYENIDFGLDKSLIDVEYYKIDNVIYKKIIDHLLLLRQKLNFLLVYKQRYLLDINNKIAENKKFSVDLFAKKNLKAKKIINSEVLKISGSTSIVAKTWDYKENFNVTNGDIIPNFSNIRPLNFKTTIESDSRIHLKLNDSYFISKIDLNFTKNLQDEVIIGFKTVKNGQIVYTSEPVKLSKFKQVALRFEKCVEIVIFSNSNFAKYISNISVFGGNEVVEKINCFGVMNLGTENYSEIMFNTNQKMDFYKITLTDLNNAKNYFFNSDLENSKVTTRIETNILVPIKIKETDRILVRFNTQEPIFKDITVYGKK